MACVRGVRRAGPCPLRCAANDPTDFEVPDGGAKYERMVGASGFGVGAQRPPGDRRRRRWLIFEVHHRATRARARTRAHDTDAQRSSESILLSFSLRISCSIVNPIYHQNRQACRYVSSGAVLCAVPNQPTHWQLCM